MRTILPKNTQIDPMFDEKSNVELIEDIHNEVYSAHDLLLKEAENILNKPIDESKIKDYQNLIKFSFWVCTLAFANNFDKISWAVSPGIINKFGVP